MWDEEHTTGLDEIRYRSQVDLPAPCTEPRFGQNQETPLWTLLHVTQEEASALDGEMHLFQNSPRRDKGLESGEKS